MKKLIFIFLLIAGLAIVLVSCSNGNNGIEIILNQNDPTVIKDGSTLAPNSVVKFAWTDLAGNSVLCDFLLERDGVVVERQDGVREVITSVSEEGHYMASIMPSGSRDVKTVKFNVNKLYEELYNSSHGLYFKDDVSNLFKQFNDKGQEKAGIIFFRLGNEKIEGTNEIINTSEGLNLIDTDGNGLYDTWVVNPAEGQRWYEFLTGEFQSEFGLARYEYFLYGKDSIKLGAKVVEGPFTGLTFLSDWAEVGLELNWPYTRYISGVIAGYDYGKIIKISERYDSNSVPEFSLLEDKMGGAITIDVSAPNVAKFANLYDTKYMQLALTYPASLTLASVEFDNFVKGKKEICSHMVLDDGREKVVVLYRGLLNGLDEQTTVSDLFARLVFETPEQNGTGQIGLTYDETGELMYGPLFRNHKNENIDGFVINYDPVQVVWGE